MGRISKPVVGLDESKVFVARGNGYGRRPNIELPGGSNPGQASGIGSRIFPPRLIESHEVAG